MTGAPSFVYFIAAGEHRIKIGRSANPERRLKALQTGSSEKLTLLGFIAGGSNEERSLHRLFYRHRIEGEWFAFCDDIWTEVDRLLAGGAIRAADKANEICASQRSDESNPILGEISHGICAYFRGLYPIATGKHVAAAAGLNREAVDRMLKVKGGMNARSLHACLEAFGPSFLAAAIPNRLRPAWVTDAVARERREELEGQIAAIDKKLQAAL